MNSFIRNELLLGKKVTDKITASTILLVGLGGVGSFACEAIARLGFVDILLIDKDEFESSNLNRQLGATTLTMNRPKVEVMKERILLINPNAQITIFKETYDEHTFDTFLAKHSIDYAIDAIDSIPAKWQLIKDCLAHQIVFVSSGGMACRINSDSIRVLPLDKTSHDPICKILRHYARKEQVDLKKIPMCVSLDEPLTIEDKGVLPSIMFNPAISGLKCVEYILHQIIASIRE